MIADEILSFWFDKIDSSKWWSVDPSFDALIREKFLDIHQKASQAELFSWRTDPLGRLAEVIVLDQFSRNMYRGKPEAFAQDRMALVLAQEAVATGGDKKLATKMRAFLYLPYMHSESKIIHEEAVKLYSQTGLEYNLEYELKHKTIIDRFNRYPHRNAVLGRESTPEELAFLKEPGSSF